MKSFKTLALLMFVGMSMASISQTEAALPFREISEYPESYTANTVTARLIESLGFRYYWATEGLTQTDLDYQITEESRTSKATMVHIYDLSLIIRNSAERNKNEPVGHSRMSYEDLRIGTLNNLKTAHGIIAAAESLDTFQIAFATAEFPFWNQINGPIADALWHCGQLVMMRRASGNPVSPNVNHFLGRVKD